MISFGSNSGLVSMTFSFPNQSSPLVQNETVYENGGEVPYYLLLHRKMKTETFLIFTYKLLDDERRSGDWKSLPKVGLVESKGEVTRGLRSTPHRKKRYPS